MWDFRRQEYFFAAAMRNSASVHALEIIGYGGAAPSPDAS